MIATVKTTSASQSTIKLVATNLIACGKLKGISSSLSIHHHITNGKESISLIFLFFFNTFAEGVELLCLVDKGTDACRYLQTYGAWDLATWIAKVKILTNYYFYYWFICFMLLIHTLKRTVKYTNIKKMELLLFLIICAFCYI